MRTKTSVAVYAIIIIAIAVVIVLFAQGPSGSTQAQIRESTSTTQCTHNTMYTQHTTQFRINGFVYEEMRLFIYWPLGR